MGATTADIYIRLSGWNWNNKLAHATSVEQEGNLIYRGEGDTLKAHAVTLLKFTCLTAISPLVMLARIVRSIAFACMGQNARAGRELVGGLVAPFIGLGCTLGTLASGVASLIIGHKSALFTSVRRAYASYEAWTNGIDLHAAMLPTFSHRVSNTFNVFGTSKGQFKHAWTTAPCLQPILENGKSSHRGLLDLDRMRKIFPLVKIKEMQEEDGKIVIVSEYTDKAVHVKALGGACEQARVSKNVCCCFQVEAAYDRVLCCDAGYANCSIICAPSDVKSIYFCRVAGIGICCATEQIDNKSLGVQQVACLTPN